MWCISISGPHFGSNPRPSPFMDLHALHPSGSSVWCWWEKAKSKKRRIVGSHKALFLLLIPGIDLESHSITFWCTLDGWTVNRRYLNVILARGRLSLQETFGLRRPPFFVLAFLCLYKSSILLVTDCRNIGPHTTSSCVKVGPSFAHQITSTNWNAVHDWLALEMEVLMVWFIHSCWLIFNSHILPSFIPGNIIKGRWWWWCDEELIIMYRSY